MSRSTIDYGIDLGTTNSTIAVLKGRETEVFKNNLNSECTPSAVWIDKQQKTYVGQRAKDRLETDGRNATCEFKLLMGSESAFTFQNSGQKLNSQELSAEVLKSLRGDVKQRSGEEVEHAVITVPAAFESPQCDATREAARLAGLHTAPLLQEPVAAAMAYGFQQSESDKAYWLVYDFGGGTFDAALMNVRDGSIQVANHGGDNQLGGKLIDWEIVERILVPAVVREYQLPDFRRGNPLWTAAIGKLKMQAEKAKIALSRDPTASVYQDNLCKNLDGDPIEFEFELQRSAVEQILESYVRRSITICKRVLSERNLRAGDVQKLVLVGGPTLTPRLREMLSDPQEGLGIPLDFSIDPLTIVARGAAIFAGTQRIEGVAKKAAVSGHYGLELNYKPVGTDLEPQIAGKVISPAGGVTDFTGHTIEFIHPTWRSGRMRLSAAGTFISSLVAERNVDNIYRIELNTPTGSRLPTVPDQVKYTIGLSIDEQPLIHSLGIALEGNKVSWLLKKGAPLPVRKRDDRRTTHLIQARQPGGQTLRIPIIEGEKERADRNKFISALEIAPTQISRDLPANSDIEITLAIDASRQIRASAFIPFLNQEFDMKVSTNEAASDPDRLAQGFAAEKARLDEKSARLRQLNDPAGHVLLERLRAERIVEDITSSLDAARVDPNAAKQCENRLLDLCNLVDEMDDLLEWPTLVTDTEGEIGWAQRRLQRQLGTAEDARQFATLEREVAQAIANHQPDTLRRKLDQLYDLGWRLRYQDPDFWINRLQYITEELAGTAANQTEVSRQVAQANRCINANDLVGLRQAVFELSSLLPKAKGDEVRKEFQAQVR